MRKGSLSLMAKSDKPPRRHAVKHRVELSTHTRLFKSLFSSGGAGQLSDALSCFWRNKHEQCNLHGHWTHKKICRNPSSIFSADADRNLRLKLTAVLFNLFIWASDNLNRFNEQQQWTWTSFYEKTQTKEQKSCYSMCVCVCVCAQCLMRRSLH